MRDTPRSVFEELVHAAFVRGHMTGSPDARVYTACIRDGSVLPERVLPGRLILALPASKRELLAQLTAKDVCNVRPDSIPIGW